MQQSPEMTNIALPFPPPENITTEQIQELLDENKELILAILENQSVGKVTECAAFQGQLQKNLMLLASMADVQRLQAAPAPHTQAPPHSDAQQGHNMHNSPAAAAHQQIGIFPQKSPFQFPPLGPQEQQLQPQLPLFQQHQAIQGHVGMGPNGISASHNNALQTGPASLHWKKIDVRGSKQDAPEAGSSDGQGMLGFGQYSRIRES